MYVSMEHVAADHCMSFMWLALLCNKRPLQSNRISSTDGITDISRSSLEYKPSLSQSNIMVHENLSEIGYTQYTYTGMIAIPPLQRTSNTRLASAIGSISGSTGPVTLFPCSLTVIAVSKSFRFS